MASITTPRIDKIVRLNSYDLLGTKCKQYQMYMCLDTLQLWYDESDSKRTLYRYVGVDTVNDLQNNIVPEFGITYYCWESNSLWLWMNRWICNYTDGKYPSAYRTDNGTIDAIYLDDQNPTIVDNNGLLRDGSVVVRDANRIIKGRIYVNDKTDNLTLSSYLGGGVRILPNGAFSTEGELYIDDHSTAYLRGEWNVLNHEMYVDYTERPSLDNNPYKTDKHRYMVWHEGNLQLSDFELTGENIYNKLKEGQENGELPSPFEFNVNKLNGLKSTDFALKTHVHKSTDISDFKEAAQANALQVMIDKLTNMVYKGAKITWSESTKKFTLSTDNFILAFTGGATGQGTVVNNTNTTIALEIDPDKHTHQDILDKIDALGTGGGADLSDYYKKKETEDLLNDMFTTSPTPGKALLVDDNKDLPGNALSASDLDHDTKFTLEGDIKGEVIFGYDKLSLTMNTDASNIISDTPEEGKALKLDSNKELPTTAYKAKELDHEIEVELEGDVTGTATLDTSSNSFKITTTLNSTSALLTPDDIGDTVAGLVDGVVPEDQLPEGILNSVKLMGNWDGSGAPSSDPEESQAWLVTTAGNFGGKDYNVGDWIYYYNSSWNRADLGVSVKSVNGISGEDITLTASDVKAISEDYIDYTIGADIPKDKIVITDKAGHIAGATVDNLTNEFTLKSRDGDVSINTTKSTNVKTDGSKDLDITMEITEDGYDNISKKLVRTIQNNGTDLPFRKNLSFSGFEVVDSNDTNTVTIKPDLSSADEILYFDGTATNDFKEKLLYLYENRDTRPFYIAFKDSSNGIQFVNINSSLPNISPNGVITLNSSENSVIDVVNNQSKVRTSAIKITFDSSGSGISSVAIENTDTLLGTKIIKGSATLTASNWITDTDGFKYTISNTNIKSTSEVFINITKDTYTEAINSGMQEYVTVSNGSFTVYSTTKPSNSINITYTIID